MLTRRTAQRKYDRLVNRAMRRRQNSNEPPHIWPNVRVPAAVLVKLGMLAPDWNANRRSGVIPHAQPS